MEHSFVINSHFWKCPVSISVHFLLPKSSNPDHFEGHKSLHQLPWLDLKITGVFFSYDYFEDYPMTDVSG